MELDNALLDEKTHYYTLEKTSTRASWFEFDYKGDVKKRVWTLDYATVDEQMYS